MGDEEFVGTAADTQRTILEDLISTKKKGNVSQLDTKKFTDTWVAYVKTVGVNDETVRMLYDGFQFAVGEPLFRYVVDSHSGSAYKSFLEAKPTKENEQGIALRVVINLLALELPAPTSENSVGLLAHAIPGLSRNKDGKPFGTLARSVGKILAKPLARKRIDESVAIESRDAALILALLREPVESFAKSGKSKSIEVDGAMQLLAWLDKQARRGRTDIPSTTEVIDDDTSQQAASMSVETNAVEEEASAAAKEARREARRALSGRPVRISRIEPTADVTTDDADPKDSSEPMPTSKMATEDDSHPQTKRSNIRIDAFDMDEVLAFLESYKNEHESLQKTNSILREAGREASSRATRVESSLRSAQGELESLRQQLSALSENYAKLQMEVSSLREANKSLTCDLAAAEEMLGMIDRRDARQADESARRLASELKVEYRDFLDAVDVPMDADLGENMREQLKNVFEILRSSGINL